MIATADSYNTNLSKVLDSRYRLDVSEFELCDIGDMPVQE
jgi:hypothetical protein